MKIIKRVQNAIWLLGVIIQAIGVIIKVFVNVGLDLIILRFGFAIFTMSMIILSVLDVIDSVKK